MLTQMSLDIKLSKYLDDALKAKKILESVSDSFCLAKWYQTSLHLTTGHTNSCFHCPTHKINQEKIKINPRFINDTDEKQIQRNKMMNGERPKECNYCWTVEDQGNLSDRFYRSGEEWAMEGWNNFNSTKAVPNYVEVNFNSACNLKCMYCSPQYSTSWMAEVNQYGGYPTQTIHNDPSYFIGDRKPIPQREKNPYLDAFWKWWPELYPNLRHFRMTGGEPLMDKNTYKVFDYVLQNPKPNLHLNVTSNFSVEPELFNKYMNYVKQLCDGEKIEHFMQFVSIDCFGDKAEYIRSGLDFNRLWDNVNTFLTEIPGRNSITFIITMNNLCLTSLRELLTAIHGLRKIYSTEYQRVWIDVPLLKNPEWMSIQIMPESYQYQLEKTIKYISGNPEESCEGFEGFKDYEVKKLQRNLDYMKVNISENELIKHKIDFYRFFTEYDKRRGTSFLKTFPEMIDWWNECMYYGK